MNKDDFNKATAEAPLDPKSTTGGAKKVVVKAKGQVKTRSKKADDGGEDEDDDTEKGGKEGENKEVDNPGETETHTSKPTDKVPSGSSTGNIPKKNEKNDENVAKGTLLGLREYSPLQKIFASASPPLPTRFSP